MDTVDHARVNGQIVAMACRALRDGVGGVQRAKDCLKILMTPDEAGRDPWRYFRVTDSDGCTIDDVTQNPPKTFREFVEAKPFRGLGEKLEDIERLLVGDPEAVVRLRELVVAGHGGDRKSEDIKTDNVSLDSDLFPEPVSRKKKADAGNSAAYTLTRLKNERPDLFARVVAKELTANAAAIEAGWRKKPTALEAAQAAFQRLSQDERREFLTWVANGD
jgi:hypothetical protein